MKITSDTQFMGRCMVKGCKHTVKRLYKDIDWNGDRCEKHSRYPLNWHSINGIVNAAHVCDSRCINAIGHNCECACGGANHGNAYL